MKFINRNLLIFSCIVLAACFGYCFLARQMEYSGNSRFIPWFFLAYLLSIFSSAFILSRRDDYHNYYGFSYHSVTYIIANGVPLILAVLHILPREVIASTLFVMATWGIGLVFHYLIYRFVFKKKTIKHYDKDDVFQ